MASRLLEAVLIGATKALVLSHLVIYYYIQVRPTNIPTFKEKPC